MTLQEMIEKRSKLYFDAHALMTGDNVSAEQRSSADRMLADAEALRADIQRLKQIEEFDKENRSQRMIPRENPSGAAGEAVDTRSYEERRKATSTALRNYLQGQNFDRRDLTIAADGSAMIPEGVTDPKIAKKDAGSVYDLVYKFRSSSGEQIKVPLLNDLANGFVLNSTAITTTDPGVDGTTLQVDDIRSNPILLENSLIQDVAFDLTEYVEKAITGRYQRTAANWITNGNGSNVAALSSGYSGVTSATAGALGYTDFTSLFATLDPAYCIGSAFLMSNTTLANSVLNIKDKNDRPIFLQFNDGGISGFAGTIFGYPVKLNPYQPKVATGNVAVQFGNFEEGYTFREVLPGVVIKKSQDRWIELNKTGFVAFARVGGAVTNAGKVTADTTQPVVSLTIG